MNGRVSLSVFECEFDKMRHAPDNPRAFPGKIHEIPVQKHTDWLELIPTTVSRVREISSRRKGGDSRGGQSATGVCSVGEKVLFVVVLKSSGELGWLATQLARTPAWKKVPRLLIPLGLINKSSYRQCAVVVPGSFFLFSILQIFPLFTHSKPGPGKNESPTCRLRQIKFKPPDPRHEPVLVNVSLMFCRFIGVF
ncbi:hypothetical protein KQX54_002523 [Cotesia glomerata]|uniref:Uncharacterized protein n=1 Tax=Cotesia glomerata TaxID=32391 RepID=A0AAV7I6B4_COTGL|nr:hypothetical protein KQX54_002523 [Cotesia glomerata]